MTNINNSHETIPQGWKKIKLVEIAAENRYSFTGGPFGSNLKADSYTEYGVRIIQLQNIGDGRFLDNHKIFTSNEKANELISCNIYPGDIIISKMGDPVARATIVPAWEQRYLMASDGIRLEVDKNNFDNKFIVESINFFEFRKKAIRSSVGTTRQRITLGDLKNLTLIIPPLIEQRKIAEILSTWDEAIDNTERLFAALRERKKGLIQRLLTGQVRFLGFEINWELNKLGDLLIPIVRKEKIDPHKRYSLIGVRWYVAGAHIHEVLNGDQIATDALSRIQKNDILYNKMWVTKNAFGIAGEEHDGAYGSSEYPQFIPKQNKMDVNFLGFFFHDARFQYNAHRLCKGTTGRARLNPGDFLDIEVRIPGVEEQIKIAEFLQTCDAEINLYAKKLKVLKQQKKGLMQRLLTGVVRVKV